MTELKATFERYTVTIIVDIKFPDYRKEIHLGFISKERPSLQEVWEHMQEELKVKNILEGSYDAGGREVCEHLKGLFTKHNWKEYISQGYLIIKKEYNINDGDVSLTAVQKGSEEEGCFYTPQMFDLEKFQQRFQWYEKRGASLVK